MGKTAVEICEPERDKLLELLNEAFAEEWLAYYQYWLGAKLATGAMRTAVEAEVLRDFLPLCTPMLEEKIRYQIRKQMALVQGEFELTQFYEMDSHLHAIWFHETGKEKLWELVQRAQIHYTRFRILDIAENRNFPTIIEEHRELLRIIRERRADEVAPLVHRHLYGSIGRLAEKVQTEFREYFIQEKETT